MSLRCTLVLGTLLSMPVISESVSQSQVFENAVYIEEVEGDLEAAVRLYQSIIDSSEDRSLVANSIFKRAQIYISLVDDSEASKAFDLIKRDFSDIDGIVARVNDYQDAQRGRKTALKPVPWFDGEVLEYAHYDLNDNIFIYDTRTRTIAPDNQGRSLWKKRNFVGIR